MKKKKITEITKIIVLNILLAVFCYLLGSFTYASFDIVDWTENGRRGAISFYMLFVICINIILTIKL